MGDDDVFGVRHPGTGEVGYCSIIGNLKRSFGLLVYPGAEGWASYQMFLAGDEEGTIPQRSLLLVFTARDGLTDIELEAVRNLKLKFAGRWPAFRSFLPDNFPWCFSAEEADFFLPVMEQARQFAVACRDDPAALASLAKYPDRVLVREFVDEAWRSAWLEPPRVLERPFPIIRPSKEMVRDIKRSCRKRDSVWEFGTSSWPAPVKEKDEFRPYYPLLILWVDRPSGYVLHGQLIKADHLDELANSFFLAMKETGRFPAAIHTIGRGGPARIEKENGD